jgi:hypothetical protein
LLVEFRHLRSQRLERVVVVRVCELHGPAAPASLTRPVELFLAGAADMVSVVIRLTLVQVATPPPMRGRVSAINMLFIGASNELGEFESGVVARFLGPVGAALFGGIGALVVTGLWAQFFPALRKADRLE